MKEKERIEHIRDILHNGINMHYNKKIILKISRKLDRYIVEYTKKNNVLGEEDGNE